MSLLVARILKKYGVPYKVIHAPQKGYRNHSFRVDTYKDVLNVILYKTEPGMAERIKRANAIGNFLAKQGLPARQTFSDTILALTSARSVKYAALYYYLPGNTIPWEAYTMERLKMLGKAMGDTHAALRNYKGTLPSVSGELFLLHARMQQYFNDRHVTQAMRQKLGLRLQTGNEVPILQRAAALPPQAIHMDFVRGNILFKDNLITGILDFEKAARGAPLYDIARTFAFLLVDCKHKAPAKIRKYFIESGYIKRGGGAIADATLFEQLVGFFLLHDFYKFLRHNPYEFLPQNEHFTRTRQALLQRGLLSVK